MATIKYPGTKNAEGVWQTIISNSPYHTRYFEFYAGMGTIFERKKKADWSLLNDIDPKTYAQLLDTFQYQVDQITNEPALAAMNKYVFTRSDFIYLDPPYIKDSRRSHRKLYRHEMMDPEKHRELLVHIRTLDANIMISTKPSLLYDELLHEWRKVKMNTIDRSGKPATEVIYMNYPAGIRLHQYDYIGRDAIRRRSNKRTIRNVKNKLIRFDKKDPHLGHAFMEAVINHDPDLARHFLCLMHE